MSLNKKKSDKVSQSTDLADVFKAFSDPTRLRILIELAKADACVHELCNTLSMSQTAVSHHLRQLRGQHLVSTRRAGRETYYAIAADFVPGVIEEVRRHVEAV
jgi:DNA-binding transcriptional ArsR family regulator